MEGREGGAVVVSKPIGANKRKGANPVRQIISSSETSVSHGGHSGQALDLSLHQESSVRQAKKVILSVPQYKLVSSSSPSSLISKLEPELSVTPVIKKEETSPSGDESGHNSQINNNFSLHSLLSSQSQTLFSLEQLKQASLIFQKHALNGNNGTGS